MNLATQYLKLRRRYIATGWLLLFFLMISFGDTRRVVAQDNKPSKNSTRVMFYNVENLFDTKDDPETDDREFLPSSELNWTESRYRRKLKSIAWVISNISGWYYPGIVGLVEVENETVIKDLITQPSLVKANYQYAVSKGADPRGIDVALLWDSKRYKLVHANEVPHYGRPTNYKLGHDPRTLQERDGKGRNSLWITLKEIQSGKMIDVFVVHAPSRRGGVRTTSVKRSDVTRKLQRIIANIKKRHPDSRILVMGDFNDNPSSPAIRQSLQAYRIEPKDSIFDAAKMYNLAYPIEREGEGTHSFEGRLWTPDQIIVSGNLLQEIPQKRIQIFKHSELWNAKRKRIYRTYNGHSYNGGYSDHLPIYVDIEH